MVRSKGKSLEGRFEAGGTMTRLTAFRLAQKPRVSHAKARTQKNSLHQFIAVLSDPTAITWFPTTLFCSPRLPPTANMADGQVTIRTRKFITNRLLARKQMVV
jgi:hypothetical protein